MELQKARQLSHAKRLATQHFLEFPVTIFTVNQTLLVLMAPLLLCILVGFLWGSTNVFLEKSPESVGLKCRRSLTFLSRLPWTQLLRTPSFILPFLFNQLGSVIYMSLVLPALPLSIAMPCANVMAAVFSFVSSTLVFKDRQYSGRQLLGIALCLAGLFISSTDES